MELLVYFRSTYIFMAQFSFTGTDLPLLWSLLCYGDVIDQLEGIWKEAVVAYSR
jgi:hypothetical protein